jgi:YidC/Oxa1 family membrane protein insertase
MLDTFIVQPMTNALLLIYQVLGTGPHMFGLAIIIFTIIVRLITLPFTYRSQRSTMMMQELQGSKKWKKIQEKHKGDRQKLAEEQMKLYQEAGYSPLSGCLPMLLQFPIIIGLYQAITRTMAASPLQLLNLSKLIYPFVPSKLIPLNSTFLYMNLGQPERLPLSFLADVPLLEFLGGGIPVLAILVAISTWAQTKITTPTSPDSQGAGMAQSMTIMMPLMLGYFAFSFASGLALYFVTSNLLGIVQGVAIRRMRERSKEESSKKRASPA